MKRLCCTLLFLAAAAAPARAHFLWVLPGEAGGVRVVFSDTPRPDDPDLLKKVAETEVFVRGAGGQTAQSKVTMGKEALEASAPGEGMRTVAAVCRYGVTQRGKGDPFLLTYYAKGFVGLNLEQSAEEVPAAFGQNWDKLPLEIVPVLPKKTAPFVRVLWRGKPLAEAEYVLLVPGRDTPVEGKSDTDGLVRIEEPTKPGVYGIRVRHVEAKEGEVDGKKYKEVRSYATLTLPVAPGAGARPAPKPAGKAEEKPAENPEATKLLADARAARAVYKDFPGFTADVVVNVEGKEMHWQAEVSRTGKVALTSEGKPAPEAREGARWAEGVLASTIGHRLDSGSGEGDTPCAFADDDAANPLGRAIRVLNDEFHSSYRIRDRQVIVVNRTMRDARFTITVLENRLTADKKFLPVSYVVNTWDLKTDALKSSQAHHQTWERVGVYDLPRTILVVKATDGKQEARSLTLMNWKLGGK
jgi:uncharacterized GH25 family protein